ncbi:hypothetical protein ES708_28839 [subsurface metagenome]
MNTLRIAFRNPNYLLANALPLEDQGALQTGAPGQILQVEVFQ